MASVAGFAVLPVRYAPLAACEHPVHYMYVRRHAGASAELPAGRTLFVANIPVDATHGGLRDLFRKAGAVADIHVQGGRGAAPPGAEDDDDDDDAGEEEEEGHGGPPASAARRTGRRGPPRTRPIPSLGAASDAFTPSGASAHIVYLDASSVDRALQLPAKYAASPYAWPHSRASRKPSGLAFFMQRQRQLRPPLPLVKEHVDSAIARYAWIRAHPQWLLDQRQGGDGTTSLGVGIQGVSTGADGELLDADGFTIVQKGTRFGRSGAGESGTFAAITPEFEEALRADPGKKKPKELVDFYRYQRREAKRQQFAALRTRFEADKQKVAQRKASLRFKPY
ncbi:hypothetical protein MSPP1_004038 [Malassezia sp. CBS 17886]|nr:hypothetical protein MSPP1_004038 [Malassezia sp. CBS 17886]